MVFILGLKSEKSTTTSKIPLPSIKPYPELLTSNKAVQDVFPFNLFTNISHLVNATKNNCRDHFGPHHCGAKI
jgi:hypothetical protein